MNPCFCIPYISPRSLSTMSSTRHDSNFTVVHCTNSSSHELLFRKIIEPRQEKICLRGCRPGPTQTGLYGHRSRWKGMYYLCSANKEWLPSSSAELRLCFHICRVSHHAAHICNFNSQLLKVKSCSSVMFNSLEQCALLNISDFA